MFQNKFILASVLVSTVLGGCATNNTEQYYWGNYEAVIYGHHLKQDEFPIQRQIDILTKDIELASASGKPVAPGVYAHLGMLYGALGDLSAALKALEMEKQLYPDSTVLIQGLENRLNQVDTNVQSGADS
jgi:hypothetical protein